MWLKLPRENCAGCGEKLTHHPRQRNPKKWCSERCRVRAWRASRAT